MKSFFWLALGLLASVACSTQKPARNATAANEAMMPASGLAASEPAGPAAAESRDDDSLAQRDQGENQADLTISQRIREAIILDDTLSFSAMEVRILTSNGKVTLRGEIASESERAMVETVAKDVAGPDNVDNQLVVR